MDTFNCDRLVIFGVGLIGGSLARALRERSAFSGEIVGVDRSARSIERALELGVIDTGAALDSQQSLESVLRSADIVLLAAPVAQTLPLLKRIVPFLEPGTIVTDVGSTKSDAVESARAVLGPYVSQFVPGHPIAGRESSGVDAAMADLYENRNVILCPLSENSPGNVERVAAMWETAGATVLEMSSAEHDSVLASVSHLPHILAFAFIEQILQSPDAALRFSVAAGGFRDFTRIAAANPEMWRDVCLANRAAVLAELDSYVAVLGRLRSAIEAADGVVLEQTFARSRLARTEWQERRDRETGDASAKDR
jgi:prephenate dehydrogenase